MYPKPSNPESQLPLPTDIPGTEEERRAYRSARSNMLLIGSDAVANALITAVTGRPADAFVVWDRHQPLAAGERDDTVIVRDLQQLNRSQQQRLYEDLEHWSGRVRFIATAAWPVYPLVARGEFHEGLYYRLNMVCLESSADSNAAIELAARS